MAYYLHCTAGLTRVYSCYILSYLLWLIHIYTADPASNGCFVPIRLQRFYMNTVNIFCEHLIEWCRFYWYESIKRLVRESLFCAYRTQFLVHV